MIGGKMIDEYKLAQRQEIREREKELREKGYKGTGVWNKLHCEFPQYRPYTLWEICKRTGVYEDD